jgi:DNA-3-methyladenine glycosylase II
MTNSVSKKPGAGKRVKSAAAKAGKTKGGKTKGGRTKTGKIKASAAKARKANPIAKPAGKSAKKGGKPAKRRNARPAAKPENLYHPGPPINSPTALSEATERLLALDPELVALLLSVGGPPPLRQRAPGFAGLAAIIVSQQVSVASANAIFGRLEAELAPLGAATLLAADDATLKRSGLSLPKMRALRALAAATAGGLDLEALAERDAREAHEALIEVKGIGPWTAEIFLLFCLGHPDAFPAGDLALQEAARLALKLETRPDARELERIAERWRPLRGVAARMLWSYYRGAKQRAGVIGQ